MAKLVKNIDRFVNGVDMYTRSKFIETFEDRFSNAADIFDALTTKKKKVKKEDNK